MALASNSNLSLEGIGGILQDGNDIEIAANISTYEELIACLNEIKPDFLLFLDNTTLGVDVAKLADFVTSENLNTQIILLDTELSEVQHPKIIHFSDEIGSSELVETIKEKMPDRYRFINKAKTGKKETVRLTEMELKVTSLIKDGYNNKEIAEKLGISEKTVKAHLTNIFVKLEIQNRYQLIVYAKQIKAKTK